MNIDELREWVHQRVDADLGSILPKIIEYGSVDLHIMGQAMAGGQEQAIAFYLLGKVGRTMSAFDAGHGPSEDTVKDTLIYAIMLRFVHEHGYWGFDELSTNAVPRGVEPRTVPTEDEGTLEDAWRIISEANSRGVEGDAWAAEEEGAAYILGPGVIRGDHCRAPGPYGLFCERVVDHPGQHASTRTNPDGVEEW